MSRETAAEPEHRHKLAAIMFTDIVGFTAISARNELDALQAVSDYEEIVRPILIRHKGNEIKSLGDGTLVEFDSALAAVNSAIELQTALHERNQLMPDARQIQLRIGIHVGEVIYRAGDVFGDGVNVAARVQTVAPPSGVCFTADVWKMVKGKVPVQVVALGRSELKNVGRLVEIYRVRFPWDQSSPTGDRARIAVKRIHLGPVLILVVTACLAAGVFLFVRNGRAKPGDLPAKTPLKTNPGSLVVLPFKNLSDNPKLGYWSDGLTEELIGDLSTVPNVGVIGRETSSTFKDRPMDARQICHELGVRAALEGSVREDAGRLRVSVRLTDGASGLTLWSANYDEPTKNVFQVQERIAGAVVLQFNPKPNPGFEAGLAGRAASNVSAYEEYLKGKEALNKDGYGGAREALQHFQAAISIDPSYAPAYAALSNCYYHLSNVFLPPTEVMPKAREAAKKAIALDPSLPEARASLAIVLAAYDWDWKGAEDAYRTAIALGPGSAEAHLNYGTFLIQFGRFREADEQLKIARALDPRSMEPRLNHSFLLYFSRNYKAELAELLALQKDFPDNGPIRGGLAECYFALGRNDEALALIEPLFKSRRVYVAAADLAMIYKGAGNMSEANRYVGIVERREVLNNYVSPYALGQTYAEMGRLDDAFAQWDIAYAARSEDLVNIAVEPRLDFLRSNPRFQSLLARMHLPVLPWK